MKLHTNARMEKKETDLIMEFNASFRANAALSSTERPEVLGGFRHDIGEQLHHYPPFHLSVYAYVQEAPRVRHFLSVPKDCSLQRMLKPNTQKRNETAKRTGDTGMRKNRLRLYSMVCASWSYDRVHHFAETTTVNFIF